MTRASRATIAGVAAAVLAAIIIVPAFAMTGPKKLTGQVGPGFSITLKKGTKRVKTLKAGKYTFVISDKSAIHNYTLKQTKGGHFTKTLTGTEFMGTKKVTLTLKKGSWKAFCTNHPTVETLFKVTS